MKFIITESQLKQLLSEDDKPVVYTDLEKYKEAMKLYEKFYAAYQEGNKLYQEIKSSSLKNFINYEIDKTKIYNWGSWKELNRSNNDQPLANDIRNKLKKFETKIFALQFKGLQVKERYVAVACWEYSDTPLHTHTYNIGFKKTWYEDKSFEDLAKKVLKDENVAVSARLGLGYLIKKPLKPIYKKPVVTITQKKPVVKPKEEPIVPVTTTIEPKKEKTVNDPVSGSVFGPARSLIGHMHDSGTFVPYPIDSTWLNKADKELLANKEALNKYLYSLYGAYVKKVQ